MQVWAPSEVLCAPPRDRAGCQPKRGLRFFRRSPLWGCRRAAERPSGRRAAGRRGGSAARKPHASCLVHGRQPQLLAWLARGEEKAFLGLPVACRCPSAGGADAAEAETGEGYDGQSCHGRPRGPQQRGNPIGGPSLSAAGGDGAGVEAELARDLHRVRKSSGDGPQLRGIRAGRDLGAPVEVLQLLPALPRDKDLATVGLLQGPLLQLVLAAGGLRRALAVLQLLPSVAREEHLAVSGVSHGPLFRSVLVHRHAQLAMFVLQLLTAVAGEEHLLSDQQLRIFAFVLQKVQLGGVLHADLDVVLLEVPCQVPCFFGSVQVRGLLRVGFDVECHELWIWCLGRNAAVALGTPSGATDNLHRVGVVQLLDDHAEVDVLRAEAREDREVLHRLLGALCERRLVHCVRHLSPRLVQDETNGAHSGHRRIFDAARRDAWALHDQRHVHGGLPRHLLAEEVVVA
mmetsp:Transcript_174560/g.554040  ORF Transcript_174560/g.554040 Transcript_174560/m.554040 type:complete len:458 (+) Transcript_174560:128-1501(+)